MVSHESLLAHLPGDTPNERLEVVLKIEADGPQVCVSQQSFGTGVGWYSQSTVVMSLAQALAFRHALSVAKATTSGKGGADSNAEMRFIIPFPGTSSSSEG